MKAWSLSGLVTTPLVLSCLATAAPAQSVDGPRLGVLFDGAASSFRPIVGILGAATVGEPIELGAPVDRGWVAPGHRFALAHGRDTDAVLLIDFRHDAPDVHPLDWIDIAPDRVAWSPLGTTAALWTSARRRLEVVLGLPDMPESRSVLELASLPAELDALAVSDDAGALLVAVSADSRGTLFRVTAGELEPLGSATRVGCITFLAETRSALIADKEASRVFVVRDVTGAAEQISVAGEAEGIVHPTAVELSEDGTTLAIASAPESAVWLLDIASSAWTSFQAASPSGLLSLRGALFQIMGEADSPLLFAEGGSSPRIVFVPPAPRPE